MSHAKAAEPIECRSDMRGSASPRVKGSSKSADCNQQQEQQQEEGRQNNAVGILTRSRTTGFGDATAKSIIIIFIPR